MSEHTAALRQLLRSGGASEAWRPADGPACITFGWDPENPEDDHPVTFRNMATLEDFIKDAISDDRLSGWMPFGTCVDIDVPLEFGEVDEGGTPRWERISRSEPTT